MFVDADEIKSVLVTEGDTVQLYTDVAEVEEGDLILWRFGPQKTRIAEIIKRDQIGMNINFIFNDEKFKDKLQMNNHTGSLTIRNIRTEHAGLYELTVISGKNLNIRFNVIVYTLPVPFINNNSTNCSSSSSSSSTQSVSRCSVLCSVLNVSAASLSWYKGNSVLSSISVSDLSISLSLPLEVEHQDKNTYSCVVKNPIRNYTTHLDISQLCQTCAEHEKNPYIVPLIAVLLVGTAVLGVIIQGCKQRQKAETGVEIQYTTATFFADHLYHMKAEAEDGTVYSSIATN